MSYVIHEINYNLKYLKPKNLISIISCILKYAITPLQNTKTKLPYK